VNIRRAKDTDQDAIWTMVEPVIRAGTSYPLPRDLDRESGMAYWFAPDKEVFVAEKDGMLMGIYYMRPNNQGPGNHICNCGYVTNVDFRGQGIAAKLCQHSLEQAKKSGYRGMQYNLVVSTNEVAVRLWKKMGFEIVGTLPMAFRDPEIGDVEAYVMFQKL
jgi:ribosomal protein S18 acetylase RimI-like enzyme